jgi:hypothetical protein
VNPFYTATLQMLEIEGTLYTGNDRILFSSDAIGERFTTWKNYIVEAQFTKDMAGNYTGLQYTRTVVINDIEDPDLDGMPGPGGGWDLSPSGMTLNPSAFGLGAGGSAVLVTDTDQEALRAFSLTPGTGPQNAQSCPVPVGMNCNVTTVCNSANLFGFNCIFDTAPNENNEDTTFVPIGTGEIWNIWQDFPFTISRHNLAPAMGQPSFLGSFEIGENGFGEPKGMVFAPNNSRFPAPFRNGVGGVMVAYDDVGPALEVFDTSGVSRGYVDLVTPGPNGILNPPPGGDDVYLFGDRADYVGVPMQIESVSADAVTGRLFITVQSDGFNNNFLYVLTPDLPLDSDNDGVVNASDNCPQVANANQADADQDSIGDVCDNCPTVASASPVDANGDGLGDACSCLGDSNRDGFVNFDDITTALSNFGATFSYPVMLPALNAGDADRNGSVNFDDLTTVLSNFGTNCP